MPGFMERSGRPRDRRSAELTPERETMRNSLFVIGLVVLVIAGVFVGLGWAYGADFFGVAAIVAAVGFSAAMVGVLASAPTLVIRLGNPLSADAWLQAGADAVWAIEGGTVWELSTSHRRMLMPDEWLRHPDEVALRLPAYELAGEPIPRARVDA